MRLDKNAEQISVECLDALREQVVKERLHLRVAGVVLPVLDSKHRVVRNAALFCDLWQISDSAFQLGHDGFEEV